MAFYWNKAEQKYYDSEGNPVEESAIRKFIDDMTAALAVLFISRANNLKDNFTLDNFNEWNNGNKVSLNALHYAMSLICFGGRNEISDEIWQIVETTIAFQISKYESFAADVLSGIVLMNGNFPVRTSLYAFAGHSTYINLTTVRAINQGKTEEMRMTRSTRPCVDCRTEAAKGWVAIGSLRLIGDSVCLMRCKCYKKFK